jgi:hypothetical protein
MPPSLYRPARQGLCSMRTGPCRPGCISTGLQQTLRTGVTRDNRVHHEPRGGSGDILSVSPPRKPLTGWVFALVGARLQKGQEGRRRTVHSFVCWATPCGVISDRISLVCCLVCRHWLSGPAAWGLVMFYFDLTPPGPMSSGRSWRFSIRNTI